MLHVAPRAVLNGCLNNTSALEPSADTGKNVKAEEKNEKQTFENERLVCIPDVIKCPVDCDRVRGIPDQGYW